jgi:hypothetical protein
MVEERQMKRVNQVIVIVLILLLTIAVAFTIVFYNESIFSKSTPTPNPALATPAPTATPTKTQFENLTITSGTWSYAGNNWNMTFTLENTGNTTSTITDLIIDGQSYKDLNPIPTINPSIETGYVLTVNQTVTITIQGTSANPFHSGATLYVVTASGNRYLSYLSS